MLRTFAPLLVAITPLTLGGCASNNDSYPSLARRPIERISGSAPVVVPTDTASEAPPLPSADVLGQLDAALIKARRADVRFHQHVSPAVTAVQAARRAPIASEAWAKATTALSDLESSRSDALLALADIDATYAAARINDLDTSSIATTRDQILAIVADQDKVLAELNSQLAG